MEMKESPYIEILAIFVDFLFILLNWIYYFGCWLNEILE